MFIDSSGCSLLDYGDTKVGGPLKRVSACLSRAEVAAHLPCERQLAAEFPGSTIYDAESFPCCTVPAFTCYPPVEDQNDPPFEGILDVAP